MKILLINKFLYPKGGDSISTIATGKLLSEKGHSVFFFGMNHPDNPKYPNSELFVNNVEYNSKMSIKNIFSATINILYSFESKYKIEKLVKLIKPDIVHLNNFAHQISPSILHIFNKYNIPSVMTSRDYKLVCPAYSMLSNGLPCEKCKNGKYYNCFSNKCTKNSYLKSFVNTLEMYLHHNIMNIYNNIDIFISPSIFLKNKLSYMGFKKPIVHLPNFIYINEFEPQFDYQEKSISYVGRLSYEKGLFTLINAIKNIDIQLKIIGDGPLKEKLIQFSKSNKIFNVSFLGYKTGKALHYEIKNSMAVVLPTESYENNPRTVIEAFALGKPVIGSRIGGIPELVIDNETGYTFEPGNIKDLLDKITKLMQNNFQIKVMGRNARKLVEKKYNSEIHYQKLLEIYQKAILKRKNNF